MTNLLREKFGQRWQTCWQLRQMIDLTLNQSCFPIITFSNCNLIFINYCFQYILSDSLVKTKQTEISDLHHCQSVLCFLRTTDDE